MNNSSHLIHGNITILEQFLKSKKTDFDVAKLCVPISISTCNFKLQSLYKELYNDIESGIYSRFQFLLYYLYKKIYNSKFYILQTNRNEIERVVNVFTHSQLHKDMESVNEMMQTIDLQFIEELFEIQNGCNLAYQFVIRNISSPLFYLYYFQKYKYSKECELIDKFNRFNKIINIIYRILKLIKNEEVS